MAFEIPPDFEPHDAQIPSWATDVERFRICFALTRLIAERDDPIFCRELYFGEIPTGDRLAEPAHKRARKPPM